MELEWLSDAACTRNLYPDDWFPDYSRSEDAPKAESSMAAKICRTSCRVRAQCEALGKPESWGIWGGKFKNMGNAALPPVKNVVVPTLGSRRRLQALAAIGWTSKEVSADIRRYTGLVLNPNRLDSLRDTGRERTVPDYVANAIERAVKHLANRTGSGNSANNLMVEAKGKGWPTPRQWRGLDYDDPEVYPDVD